LSKVIKKESRSYVGFLLLVLSLLLLWYLGRFFHLDIRSIQRPLEHFPVIVSSLIFICLYVVVTFFVFFSKDIFYLSVALFFGPYLSTLLILVAEIINACILFHLARFLGRAYVDRSLGEKYRNLDDRLGRIGLFWLFIFRAAPLIPYRFLDLAAGLTKMRFGRYLFACVLGSPIKLFWVQYVLFGVGEGVVSDPHLLVEYFSGNPNVLLFSLVYIILVAIVIWKVRRKY